MIRKYINLLNIYQSILIKCTRRRNFKENKQDNQTILAKFEFQ